MFHAGAKARPLDADVLNEFGIELFRRVAPLTPIQYKLGYRIGNEVRIDPGALHDFHGVPARLPVAVQWREWFDFEQLRFLLLVMTPAA